MAAVVKGANYAVLCQNSNSWCVLMFCYDLCITFLIRHPSCYSCIRVNTLKSSTDAVMQKLLNLLNQNEFCGGMNGLEIGEQNGGEQAHEGSYLVHKCPYSGLENVLFVRGSGPHDLHCDGQPGQSIKEIIVSRKCAESVLRGAQVCSLSLSLSLSLSQPVRVQMGEGLLWLCITRPLNIARRCPRMYTKNMRDLWVIPLGTHRSQFFPCGFLGGTNQAAAGFCSDSYMLHFAEHKCKQPNTTILSALMPHPLTWSVDHAYQWALLIGGLPQIPA